jgi:mono/diheme cytochrome c family protein
MRQALLFALLLAAPLAHADAPDGAAIYVKRCAGCHGEDGKANTRPGRKYAIADFTEAGWAKDWTPEKIQQTVAEGVKGKMPAFQDKLSPAEMQAVSARVLELAKGAPAPKK